MKKLATVIICALVSISVLNGQSTAKFNPKAGFSVFTLADEKTLLEDRAHPTQQIGFDIIIERNGGLFIPGFYYYRFALSAEDFALGELFQEREYIHMSKMPVTFGYQFKTLPLLKLGVYGGASANFFIAVDNNDLGLIADRFRGVHPAWHIGGQIIALDHITIDLKYDHGMTEILKSRPDSKIRGFSMTAGFIF